MPVWLVEFQVPVNGCVALVVCAVEVHEKGGWNIRKVFPLCKRSSTRSWRFIFMFPFLGEFDQRIGYQGPLIFVSSKKDCL